MSTIGAERGILMTEPECCDGSDEPSGVCKNECQAIGEAYQLRMEGERKLRSTVGLNLS